jgi:hypothetical protein
LIASSKLHLFGEVLKTLCISRLLKPLHEFFMTLLSRCLALGESLLRVGVYGDSILRIASVVQVIAVSGVIDVDIVVVVPVV